MAEKFVFAGKWILPEMEPTLRAASALFKILEHVQTISCKTLENFHLIFIFMKYHWPSKMWFLCSIWEKWKRRKEILIDLEWVHSQLRDFFFLFLHRVDWMNHICKKHHQLMNLLHVLSLLLVLEGILSWLLVYFQRAKSRWSQIKKYCKTKFRHKFGNYNSLEKILVFQMLSRHQFLPEPKLSEIWRQIQSDSVERLLTGCTWGEMLSDVLLTALLIAE